MKTRLAASIGDDRARYIYHRFLSHLLDRLSAVPANRQLCFWPPESRANFEDLAGSRWQLREQAAGDLGARMSDFFCRCATAEPSQKAVLVGSDLPTLTPETIQQAFELLDQVEVVIGPSTDGGYYLIAMRGAALPIFDDIPWSTPSVLPVTLDRLKAQNIRFQMLTACRDVDELEDLLFVQAELRALRELSSGDRRLLQAIERCLSGDPVDSNDGRQ